MKGFGLSLAVVGLACIAWPCTGLSVDFSPVELTPGQSNNLTITCDAQTTANLSLVTIIQLKKDIGTPTDVPVAEIVTGGLGAVIVDPGLSTRTVVSGQIDLAKGPPFLSVEVNSSTDDDAGNYYCVMSYLDTNHALGSVRANGTLTLEDLPTSSPASGNCTCDFEMPDFSNITNAIMDLQKDVDDLKNMAITMNCSSTTASAAPPTAATQTAAPPTAAPPTANEVVAFTYRVFASTDEVPLDNKRVPFVLAELETAVILDPATHVITIPKTGIYNIAVTLVSGKSAGSGFEASINVNDVPQASLLVQSTHSSSLTVNLKLIKGQEVTVTGLGDQLFVKRVSYIAGHLIN